jgi:predicted DNA-binding transcriptional regulator AlpA
VNIDAPTPTAPWLTEQQLAEHLQISTRHLINLRKAGLPFIQLGSSVRYDLSEVEQFIRSKRRLSSHIERQQRRKALAAK